MEVIKKWLNAREAAEYIGVSYGSLRNMIYRRELPFRKLGRRLRFDIHELDQELNRRHMRIGEW